MKKHMELLGYVVSDRVTGFKGVVTTVSFDLYGCVQAVVSPQVVADKPGDLGDAKWFDVKRLLKVSNAPVMELPTFEVVPGGVAKSLPPAGPL